MPNFEMDYEMMSEMSQVFDQGAAQLEETANAVANLAGTLDQGALLGKAGNALASALRDQLCLKLMKLSAKYSELRGDVLAAMSDAMQTDNAIEATFED